MKTLGRLVFGLGLLALMGPLAWALALSFLDESALFTGHTKSAGLDHYRAIFHERDFMTPLQNSLVVSTVTTVSCVSLASLTAYALARLRFAGRRSLATLFLMVAMFPQISIVAPLFSILKELGLIDTYAGLTLPYLTFALPLAVWLMTSYFRQLPRGVEEAAMLDGASRWQVLTRIVLPMALPGLMSTAIVTFVFCWNEFLFAISFTVGRERQTVPVAIALFRGLHQVSWGEILAATVVASAPVVLLVLAFQRRIVEGLTRR